MDKDLVAKIEAEYQKVASTPQFHREVMGNYQGERYMLGYTVDQNGNPYIHVSVMPNTTQEFPKEISIGQYNVLIKVTKDFSLPWDE